MSDPTVQEKLISMGKRLKEILSKDYSLSDFKTALKTVGRFAKNVKEESLRISSTSGAGNQQLDLRNLMSASPAMIMRFAQRYVSQHRNVVLIFLLIAAILLLHRFVLAPFAQNLEAQLAIRPAQWSQLQSLMKLSKFNASTSPSMISTVAPLDDMELQKIRNVLTSRGLKPAVLRLTSDNPPRLELQASDVMFGVVIDAVEELRTTWRLYPRQLNAVAAGGPGVVNISASFTQFNNQASALIGLGVGQ